jgi:transmembrane sensor
MTGNRNSPYQIEDLVTDESFINYFFELNQDDIIFWKKWILSHPDSNEIVEEAKSVLRNFSLTLPEREFEKEISKIRKAINYEETGRVKGKPAIIRMMRWGKPRRSSGDKKRNYAILLLPLILIIAVTGYFIFKSFTTGVDRLTEKHNESTKPEVFSLSDGTVVTLAPQSIFRYPADFGNKDRKVYLKGEAQFHVSRDEAHPFEVYEGDIVAVVLGTIFNVKEQPGDSGVMVELIKGKLRVETLESHGISGQSIILNPDERVIYKGHGQKMYKEKWQSQHEAILQVKHLVFRQNNFEEIAIQFKTVFGLTLVDQNSKKILRFTGEFNNASAIDILESICIVEKMTYEVQGDSVFIK